MKTIHFISGLPRSGSTLLSSILNQNPRFTASISDPLHEYVKSITQITNSAVAMESAVPIDKRRELMIALFESFYKHDREVCFNTNRAWTSDTALLKDLFPSFKMIVCIRDIPWILDSFERLNSKNPHTIKPLYNHQDLPNVYARSKMLMGDIPNYTGYVGMPLLNLKQAIFCDERAHLCFVEYDALARNTEQTIKNIYKFLEEPYFNHNFSDVESSHDEYDQQAKIAGLHYVRKKVAAEDRRTVLPDDLYHHYAINTFWKQNFDHTKKELNWIEFNSVASNKSKQL